MNLQVKIGFRFCLLHFILKKVLMIRNLQSFLKFLKDKIWVNMGMFLKKWENQFGLLNLEKIRIEGVELMFVEKYSKLKKLSIIHL